MFSLRKSSNKSPNQNSVHPGFTTYPSSNPFEIDDDTNINEKTHNTLRKTSPRSELVTPKLSTNPFDDIHEAPHKSTSMFHNLEKRNRFKNNFRDCGGIENQTVQELEDYAMYKAEETTKNVNSCIKIAEDIRGDATKTLVLLHQQGEQINKAHTVAADIDIDLSRGERLLGSLGGLFSKTWKPTRTRTITGPVTTRDDPIRTKRDHLEQRERLGLSVAPYGRSNIRNTYDEPTNTLQKVQLEKAKQDDSLSDLSNMLEELKGMAIGMGSEIDRQNKALDPFMDDVEELNFRVRGANQRGRRLLGK